MRENKTVREIAAEPRRFFPLQPPQAAARGRALQAAVEKDMEVQRGEESFGWH